MTLLTQELAQELVDLLKSNIVNVLENDETFRDEVATFGFRGYDNFSDEDLLDEYMEAFEKRWEKDPRNEDDD